MSREGLDFPPIIRYNNKHLAGVVQWQHFCFPSRQRGFDPRYLLQRKRPPCGGLFSLASITRDRTGRRAAAREKQPGGLFFRPRVDPRYLLHQRDAGPRSQWGPAFLFARMRGNVFGVGTRRPFSLASITRDRTGRHAAAREKQTGGLFFRLRVDPRCLLQTPV